MTDIENIVNIAKGVLINLAKYHEENGSLPNLAIIDKTALLHLTLGKLVSNLTFSMAVVEHNDSNYYLDITSYFGQEDYIYPEGADRENAEFIIKAAPYENIYNNILELSAENITEAVSDSFHVLIDILPEMVKSLVGGENIEE